MNPFPTVGYSGAAFFCDREKETQILLSAIKNNRPINISSIRRIGKTALIRHVFEQLPRAYVPVYIDLDGTDSLKSFISTFTNALSKELARQDQSILKKLLKWASGFGASISLDSLDGSPKLQLTHNHRSDIASLDGLMSLMDQSAFQFVIAIDEFQQITNYDDKNVEGWVRSKMQEFSNVRFIFSGSEYSLMQNIFNSPSRPFYQITQPLHLNYIPRDPYQQFIASHFTAFHKINERDILNILEWCRYHTYYVQYFCNLLYSHLEENSYNSLIQIQQEIIESHKHFFLSQKELITDIQWKFLKSLSKVQSLKNLTSKDFVQLSGMATTTLQRTAKSLLEKSLILKENDELKIYNVFLQRYLETLI